MITYEEALRIVLEHAHALEPERVALRDAVNRVLAEDVASDMDMPPFNKSAMDGYACRRADLPGPLRVVGLVQAGSAYAGEIGPGECAKIMTGAVVPPGADCVIMVEHTAQAGPSEIRFTGHGTDTNICAQGEDIRAGETVLRRGTRLGPQHVGMLASVGCVQPLVARRPRVGVIATGDELVEPEEQPGPAQIRTSNSMQICVHVEEAGAVAGYYGIARDEASALDDVIRRALSENDVIVLSGGVSMGEFDLVPDILRKNGINILFDAVAVKPGKPTTFGVGASACCFGLPGNPVSTFVQCELLVKPFLFAMMGRRHAPVPFQARLATSYRRKKADRLAWVPVAANDSGAVTPLDYHGPAHLGAMCRAEGLMIVPIGIHELEEGALVRVRPI